MMRHIVVPERKPLEALFRYPVHRIKDGTYAAKTGEYGCPDDHEPHDAL